MGIVAKNRLAKQKSQPATALNATAAAAAAARPHLRTDYAYEIRRAIGLDPEPYYGPMATRRPPWTPTDYGQARLAAVGWLFSFVQKGNLGDGFVAEATKPGLNRQRPQPASCGTGSTCKRSAPTKTRSCQRPADSPSAADRARSSCIS